MIEDQTRQVPGDKFMVEWYLDSSSHREVPSSVKANLGVGSVESAGLTLKWNDNEQIHGQPEKVVYV